MQALTLARWLKQNERTPHQPIIKRKECGPLKQKYFRLPWCRLNLTQRKLYRMLLTELQDESECLVERRLKRLQSKQQLKQIVRAML